MPINLRIWSSAAWRWIFYINLPLGLAAIALTMVLVPDKHGDERRRFDWPGFVLTGGASFCLLWGAEALTHPPVPWVATAWSAAAGTALLWLAARHLNRSAHPIVRLAALDYRRRSPPRPSPRAPAQPSAQSL
ncbi:hypothetical protein [Sphingomonas abietis]|uniref:MFS transporter n=1 Tax=Sphingomonas abietis TaxID=3012344 RepID=A0ABY7NN09_9SPHN|nr:hypothetical protein [Sphingomonas abietis]WBO22909.1 hypothetical protein PBT88_01825 [Sphingomonas abietis]